jgi:hypothetical protein
MGNIVSSLNLNKTPSLVQSNSLIFAKNIRLDADDTIHRDHGIFPISILKDEDSYTAYSNIFFRIEHDINSNIFSQIDSEGKYVLDENNNTILDESFKIVGIVPSSKEFYVFISNNNKHYIIKYDEQLNKFFKCSCNWTYNGGKITGKLINNLRGEKILNIGESCEDKLIPFKSINLIKSKDDDDESIYTQTPNVPLFNISLKGIFNYKIPNGCYQFFIRYKIRDNFYTDWFPASKELFTGNSFKEITNYGTVKYVNTHLSSSTSFILNVKSILPEEELEPIVKQYESFQIGFIISTDEMITARAWKHFSLNTEIINFDYKNTDGEEIEIIDMLSTTYQLYNVGNITSFKNKLYISNYIETNFNPDYSNKAKDIKVSIGKYNLSRKDDIPAINGNKVVFVDNSSNIISGVNLENSDIVVEISLNSESIGIETEDSFITRAFNLVNSDNRNFKDVLKDSIEIPYVSSLANVKENVINDINVIDVEFSMKGCNQRDFLMDLKTKLIPRLPKGYNVDQVYDFTPLIADREHNLYQTKDNIKTIKLNYYKDSRNIIHRQHEAIISTSDDLDHIPDNLSQLSVDDIVNKIIYGDKKPTYGEEFINVDGINTVKLGIDTNKKLGILEEYDNEYSLNYLYNVKTIGIEIIRTITIYNKLKEKDETLDYSTEIQLRINPWRWDLMYGTVINTNIQNTLIPYQHYKFYIHYIKKNGEITNGYPCNNNEDIEVPYCENANVINYPIFENIDIPKEFDGYFFTILHTKNNVATVYNIRQENSNLMEMLSIDIDLGNISEGENISIKQNTNRLYKGTYHFSSDATNIKYFGANGVISLDSFEDIDPNKLAYIIEEYSLQDAKDTELIKCTPFIYKSINKYDNWNNLNLLGYICTIYPLHKFTAETFYNDGINVYSKDYNSTDLTDVASLKLKEITDVFPLLSTESVRIYSNYNLNYLALREDIKTSTKSIKDKGTVGNNVTYTSYIYKLIPSITMNAVYELPTMYKTYTRKTYSVYKTNEIIKFDNTIRSSILQEDEGVINIFKFDNLDYYNIPTDKDIIVNLVAIGDAILVHTKDSIFKFSGSNNLQSSNGEIQTTENVFNTCVSELFGSDFGFAGLQDKKHCIICEQGYIFFDKDSNIIYNFSGSSQLDKLNDSIEKLFRYKSIENIYFANDYYNNRIFICIEFEDTTKVTLSYNPTTKKFISLHDFWFNDAFNTKNYCYFITENKDDICYVDKTKPCCYTKLNLVDTLYPQIKESSRFPVKPRRIPETQSINLNKYKSIIDVIVNTNFETIKTLNAIHWCSKYVNTEFKSINNEDLDTLKLSETFNDNHACDNIRIYTDTCLSDLINVKNISNNNSLNTADNYESVRYNQGRWTLNYFRNIQNSNNNINSYISDENSLIEGKYFVVRFIFSSDFKLESLSLNYNSKL